ncbi:MAG: hypothetical protein IPG38_11920 [Chitinophagaceae bacterium]|nr:hypothetical protein [Chitinophagaceae bacterium]
MDSLGIRSYELLSTKGGSIRIISSVGLWRLKGRELSWSTVQKFGEFRIDKLVHAQQRVSTMAEGPDSIFFFATYDNEIYFANNSDETTITWPPFNFPPKENHLIKYQHCILIIAGIFSLALKQIIFIG